MEAAGIRTLYIEPGSPWQNGFIESFHSSFRRECLDREQLWSLSEARVVIEDWRHRYNAVRPHKSLGLETPLAFARGAAAQAAGSGRATPSLHPLLDFASLRERYRKPKSERLMPAAQNRNRLPGSRPQTAVLLASSLMLLCHGSTASASVVFSGVMDLDYTSSIEGAPKNTRFVFSVTLSRTAQDTIHRFDTNGWGGVTLDGFYNASGGAPITDFQMALDPTSNGTFDPSSLTYDYANSQIFTVDANAAVGQTEPSNEHLTLYIPVLTPDSPILSVYLNLYNSSFIFDPVSFGSRQLILDTSTPVNGFTLDELFLDGLETLGSF